MVIAASFWQDGLERTGKWFPEKTGLKDGNDKLNTD